MSTQIKNTLFRFITMRAPELLEKDAVNKAFVTHPETDEITENYMSVFLSELQATSDGKRNALKNATANFEDFALVKKEQLFEDEMISKEFFDFAIWLTKNRNRFTTTELNEKITAIPGIQEGIETNVLVAIWDNLLYQITNSKSNYLRDAILSVLVADFFLKNYTAVIENIDELRKLAQARVIIPKAVFEKEDVSSSVILKKQALLNLPIHTKQLDNEIQTVLNNQKIETLKNAASELKLAQKKYQKAYQKEYDVKYKEHLAAVKMAYDTAEKVQRTYIDPETNLERTFTEYVNLELPSFEFNPTEELDVTTITSSVSNTTASLVESIMETHNLETFEEINDFIDTSIASTTETIFNTNNGTNALVSTNGVLIPISNNTGTDTPNAVTISGVGLGILPIMPLQLLFNQITNLTEITAASYTATMSGGVTQSGTSFESSVVNGKLLAKIFTEGLAFNEASNLTLSGEFTLTNGTKIQFTGTVNVFNGSAVFLNRFDLKGKGTFTVQLLEDTIGTADVTSNVIDYIPSGFGISRLGVADYRKVEQEVCCYVPGEVSHIENVMAREYKEKTTRRLRRTEDTTTLSNEQEIEKLTDTTSTDRFEMNQEVSSLLAEDTHQGSFVNSGVSYNGFSLNAGADFATNTTTEQSNSQAVTHAKEITERALDRVVKKVKEERVSKIIEEFSEENTHGFDNRKGDNHVSGVYRWVDKVYKNKIVNYGKRLMYEFMIPEPASFHNLAIQNKENYEVLLEKPIDPRVGINGMALKVDANFDARYKSWVEKYNVAISEKPKNTIIIGQSYSQNKNEKSNGFSHSEVDSIKIPDGYESIEVSIFLHGGNSFGAPNGLGVGSHILSSGEYFKSAQISGNILNQPAIGYKEEFPVSYTAMALHTSSASVKLKCQITEEAKDKWRLETFNAIIKAYEEKLAVYNEQLTTLKSQQFEKVRTNPGFYRQIENVMLRKNCIEYLVSNEALGKNYLKDTDSLALTRVDYNSNALETYAAKVKFFEQAFEWNLMSYYFYPFYWANKEKWETLYNINDIDDPTFRAFLQSGMARVILTVRPGFEEAVNWYMATGQIWNGGQVPTMDDELFVSIIEELRNPEGEVEDTWESRVPTSLTLIQAGSIGLNVEGLPCNSNCGDNLLFDSDMNPIVQTNAAIGDTATTTEAPTGETPPADA